MVIITFDDAVNSENWDLYTKKLFIPSRFVTLLFEPYFFEAFADSSMYCHLFLTERIQTGVTFMLRSTPVTNTTTISMSRNYGTMVMR